MSKENMGRNAEHYADPTPTAAMRPVEITRPPQGWRYVEELSNE